MSSLNCFRRTVGAPLSHSGLEFHDGHHGVEAVDPRDAKEEFDGSTLQDNFSYIDDGCSTHSGGSKFERLRCQSPRPEANVAVRTLKTGSLSSKYRSKLRGSNPSPMLSCMKGNTQRTPKKKKSKQLDSGSFDSYDPQELQRSRDSLSSLVRSHSDSTCLAIKSNTQTARDTNSDCSIKHKSPPDKPTYPIPELNGNLPLALTPQLFHNQPTPSYGYTPQSPYINFHGFMPSPQIGSMSGYGQVMTPPSYGIPVMNVGVRDPCEPTGYQGYPYPSPQLSTCSLMFPCSKAGVYPDYSLQRPCSLDGYSGGPLPTHSSVHRSALENPQKLGGVGGGGNGIGVRAPMYSMTSPMPQKSLISDNKSKPPNNQQPRPNHHQQYQQPSQNDTVHYQHQKQLSAEERVPAAPHPARRQFTSSFQPSPQQTAQTSSAFRRPNSNGPPAYESLREPATAGRQSTNGMPIGNGPNSQSFVPIASPVPITSAQQQVRSVRSARVNNTGHVDRSSSAAGQRMPASHRPTSPFSEQSSRSQRPPQLSQRRQTMSPVCQLPEFVNSPPPLSPQREARLNVRGAWNQLRQENLKLAQEISEMQNQVSRKDRELKSCNHKRAELSKNLEAINMWCEWLAGSSTSQTGRPSIIPTFDTNDDTARWQTLCDDLCRLDKTIGSLRSRRSHPTVSRLTVAAPKPPQPGASSNCGSRLPPQPPVSDFISGRNSSAGAAKTVLSPVPSPRFNRPASVPVDTNCPQTPSYAPQLPPPQPPARPPLPPLSPNPRKARYASQKEIAATYLTPSQSRSDHSDEYKRTANEFLQAQLASRQLQSVEVVLPEATKLSSNDNSLPVGDIGSAIITTAVPYQDDDSNSVESTSSSADTPRVVKKPLILDGSEDSAIADTEGSPLVNQGSVRENAENSKKPILRRITGEEGGSAKAAVRFHPLALLLDAALEGDFELVKKTAAEVSDVSESNDEGITALHNAVCAGRTDVVEFLVCEAGADVNAGDTDGWTPLHCAASCGNITLARLLVENGAALHARTLSDHETSLEKCDQGDLDAECERYLSAEQELLGSADEGRVYAIFPRGLEAAGPGSPDANIAPDELPIWPNEQLRIVDRSPAGEPDWMLAEKVATSPFSSSSTTQLSQQGLVPRAFISRFPLVRIPPASRPMAQQPKYHLHYRSPSPINEEDEEEENETHERGDSPQMVERSEEAMVEVEDEQEDEGGEVEEEEEEDDDDDDDDNNEMVDARSASEISMNGQLNDDDAIIRTAM